MNNNTTGKKIRDMRKAVNLTQQQLADMIGVSNKAVSKWENGEGYPDIENLKRVSAIFNTSIDELVSNKPTVSKTSPLSFWLVSILSLTGILYLFPFLKINPYDISSDFLINLSGLKLLMEGFINFRIANLLLGISLLIILINIGMQIYKIYKNELETVKLVYPILSLMSSIIVLAIVFILTRDPNIYATITLSPVIIVVLQMAQLTVFIKATSKKLV